MHFAEVYNILDGEQILGKKFNNKMDLMELANIGIANKALHNLTIHFSLSLKQMASLLSISERTLQRYTSDQHLNKDVSEQVIQIAEVLVKGTDVFNTDFHGN